MLSTLIWCVSKKTVSVDTRKQKSLKESQLAGFYYKILDNEPSTLKGATSSAMFMDIELLNQLSFENI